jgi:hypothetical protein
VRKHSQPDEVIEMIEWDKVVYMADSVEPGAVRYVARVEMNAQLTMASDLAKQVDDADKRRRLRQVIAGDVFGEVREDLQALRRTLSDLWASDFKLPSNALRALEQIEDRLIDIIAKTEAPVSGGGPFPPIVPASPWSNRKGVGDKS